MKRSIACLLFHSFLLLAALIFCGCNPEETSVSVLNTPPPVYKADPTMDKMAKILSIHRIVEFEDKSSADEIDVPGYFRNRFRIYKNPLLYSKNILSIEARPKVNDNGYYTLRLTLDQEGIEDWQRLVYSSAGNEYLGLLIDGIYYCGFMPEPIFDVKNVAVIDIRIDEITARELARYSVYNYKTLNLKEQKNDGLPVTASEVKTPETKRENAQNDGTVRQNNQK